MRNASIEEMIIYGLDIILNTLLPKFRLKQIVSKI